MTWLPAVLLGRMRLSNKSPALRQETSLSLLASFGRMSISLHPDTSPGRAPAASPVEEVASVAKASETKIRRRLFTKYVALFVAVVAVALLPTGFSRCSSITVSTRPR